MVGTSGVTLSAETLVDRAQVHGYVRVVELLVLGLLQLARRVVEALLADEDLGAHEVDLRAPVGDRAALEAALVGIERVGVLAGLAKDVPESVERAAVPGVEAGGLLELGCGLVEVVERAPGAPELEVDEG